MSEDAQSSHEPTVAPTLDDVVAEFNAIPTPTAEPRSAEPAAPQPVMQNVDPYDEQQFNQWQQRQAQTQTALQSEIQNLRDTVTQQQQESSQAKVNADIQSAVKTVSEKSGLDNSDYVEFKLEKRAQEDEGFRRLWENREANPKLLSKALDAISAELANSTEFRSDPQIAENHRAAMQSQSNGTPAPAQEFNNDMERQLAEAKTPQERDQVWSRLRHSG